MRDLLKRVGFKNKKINYNVTYYHYNFLYNIYAELPATNWRLTPLVPTPSPS